jgi:hypothetical protein
MMMFGTVGMVIGQAFSLVAVLMGYISYQMKSTKGILFFQILTAVFFSVHYLLIGAMTAAAVNFMGVFSGFCYYLREKKGSRGWFVPIFFISLRWVTGILTWEGWYSLLLLTGLTVSSIGLAISKPQMIRKLYLVRAPLCLSYNIIVFSTGGMIYELATLISALIGIFKSEKASKKQQSYK